MAPLPKGVSTLISASPGSGSQKLCLSGLLPVSCRVFSSSDCLCAAPRKILFSVRLSEPEAACSRCTNSSISSQTQTACLAETETSGSSEAANHGISLL